MTQLILASASPRRQQLLTVLGIEFEVKVADIAEDALENESPRDLAVRLAESKAWHGYNQCAQPCRVLGGDTVVCSGRFGYG